MRRTILYRTGRTPMLLKISIGFLLGILFGFIAAPLIPYSPKLGNHVMPFLELVGKIFLRLLSMIIIPLVFASIVDGIASIGDTKTLGRLGLKTLALFFLTTLIAAGIGMLCANVIKPGTGMNVADGIHSYSTTPKPFRDMLLELIPSNPLASMLNTNVIQIIVFAIFTGIACIFAGNTGKRVAGFFTKVSEIMQHVTYIVMQFAPFGVFALIATASADFGLRLIAPFAKIIIAVYSGCAIHALVVYSLMIIIFCHKSPLWLFRGIHDAAITAFVTRSSSVTLPITFDNVRENLCVSDEISSFILPLGATLNMDGTVIYHTVCAIFVAIAYGIPLTFELQVSIFSASVIASIGTVGVPSAGLIMLTMVLTSAGLPVEGVGLVAGIDVVLCSARTCLNVIGDGVACAVIASSEGEDLTRESSRDRMPVMNYGA